jgi:hypothetical protein
LSNIKNLAIIQNMDSIQDIFKSKKITKAPAHMWQEMALKIITELNVPPFKRSSVFKVCKNLERNFIEKCFDDTKELAKGKDAWRYFFKLTSQTENKPK